MFVHKDMLRLAQALGEAKEVLDRVATLLERGACLPGPPPAQDTMFWQPRPDVGFSSRALGLCVTWGICTARILSHHSAQELLDLPGCNEDTLDEFRVELEKYGLSLRGEGGSKDGCTGSR